MNPHPAGQLPLDFSPHTEPVEARSDGAVARIERRTRARSDGAVARIERRTRRPVPSSNPEPRTSNSPVGDRRRAKDRARQEERATVRAELLAAYRFEADTRDRLRLCQISAEEFQQTRDWLGF